MVCVMSDVAYSVAVGTRLHDMVVASSVAYLVCTPRTPFNSKSVVVPNDLTKLSQAQAQAQAQELDPKWLRIKPARLCFFTP